MILSNFVRMPFSAGLPLWTDWEACSERRGNFKYIYSPSSDVITPTPLYIPLFPHVFLEMLFPLLWQFPPILISLGNQISRPLLLTLSLYLSLSLPLFFLSIFLYDSEWWNKENSLDYSSKSKYVLLLIFFYDSKEKKCI